MLADRSGPSTTATSSGSSSSICGAGLRAGAACAIHRRRQCHRGVLFACSPVSYRHACAALRSERISNCLTAVGPGGTSKKLFVRLLLMLQRQDALGVASMYLAAAGNR